MINFLHIPASSSFIKRIYPALPPSA
ncbi:hypothetical protein AvCA_38760 [Azotobacter vinelandii CA]|uniref:Uncharacterized protein n=2 Tax=Azotobacter vinelandii TaxID=354 RepID=C1DSS3_AZOVD|nr:hypothetical protein Avin_38760 [Azotobacter vinelandii DJ]AGK14502.1 hypothetical protein AvCA_38760 [Azotobacter vinelandii CA]AGK21654.1 hypothetical protein AvCA6_38760 [Azotobacter vinelandii CA6]